MDPVLLRGRFPVSRLLVCLALLSTLLVAAGIGAGALAPTAHAAGGSGSGSHPVKKPAIVRFISCIAVDLEIIPTTPVNPTYETLSGGITDKCRDSNGNPATISNVYVAITDLLSCPDGAPPVVNFQKTFGPLYDGFYQTVTFYRVEGPIVCEISGIFPTLGQTLKGNAVGTIKGNTFLGSGSGQVTYNFLATP